MMHRYTAKIYFQDGQTIEGTGDDIERLIVWIYEQAEAAFNDVKGEIIDNHTHHIVKSMQYSPPNNKR